MSDKQAVCNAFDENAELYQQRHMDQSAYHDTFDVFYDLVVTPQARVLELGCGPGNVTRYLLDKRPDFRIFGLDLAPNMVRLARQNNPEATFVEMDCREIYTLKGPFDAVMAAFCLPYLTKTETDKLIQDVADLLTGNGVLYLSAMEGPDERSGPHKSSDGKHELNLYYYQTDYFTAVLKAAGFASVGQWRKPFATGDGADIVVIGKKL